MGNLITLDELKGWFKSLEEIIVDLNICINNARRLFNPKNGYEYQVIEHGFFQLYPYQLKFIIVIQLCKLLSSKKTQKGSFLKLLNKLVHNKYDLGLRELIRENKMNGSSNEYFKMRSEIILYCEQQQAKLRELEEPILSLENLRDELYAHKDPGKNPKNVTFKELERLVHYCNEFHNSLSLRFFRSVSFFDRTDSWSIGDIVYKLAENKKSRS